jgi:DNA-binding HxlR family transcriptional regulator
MTIPHQQACPIAASLNQLGDAWTLLIVREANRGVSRFSDFRKNTGIAKNLLAQRLIQMVEHGILEKHDVGSLGTRFEYRLTAKGKALAPMMATIIQWVNRCLKSGLGAAARASIRAPLPTRVGIIALRQTRNSRPRPSPRLLLPSRWQMAPERPGSLKRVIGRSAAGHE